eukprot:NODE_12288_length_1234_cov_3.591689.p2 GENE.NODE_12288_length_1234_cov_3.591689~~NODE_12288_length_1234_cov_3.591689.p2  ORF type:complete len:209 (+),score=43.15 NODE_12288_length_1234_cov_3.591689:603-1229(+)
MGFCAGVCLVSYITVALRSWWISDTPGSLQRRQLVRASMYPLNFLLSYTLIILCYAGVFGFVNWVTILATLLESFKGLMNVFTYCWQSRYSAVLRGQRPAPGFRENEPYHFANFASFSARIGEVDVIGEDDLVADVVSELNESFESSASSSRRSFLHSFFVSRRAPTLATMVSTNTSSESPSAAAERLSGGARIETESSFEHERHRVT